MKNPIFSETEDSSLHNHKSFNFSVGFSLARKDLKTKLSLLLNKLRMT